MPRTPEQLPLHHLFRHNAWATTQLFAFCERLSEGQMAATAPGAVGSLFETLHHYIQAEGGYLSRLAPDLMQKDWRSPLAKDMVSVRARAEQMERLWLEYAAAIQTHRRYFARSGQTSRTSSPRAWRSRRHSFTATPTANRSL